MTDSEINVNDLSREELLGLIHEHEKTFVIHKVVKIGFVIAIAAMILVALS